jgi:outer membrane receptor for ferrienterochelin and colicins
MTPSRPVHTFAVLAALLATYPLALAGQVARPARLSVTAAAQGKPVEGAEVRSAGKLATTDSAGRATLSLPGGRHRVTVWAFGYSADTLEVTLRAGRDTTVLAELSTVPVDLAPLVVRSMRGVMRVEQEAERVEVLAPEDVQEKTQTSPGNILNLLVEMGGIQVQRMAPGLGGATIRVQGVPGPYTLLLADGLPLYGGRTPSFSLAQTPPLDLAQVEVIKGAATSLYGPSALGGVVDLISKAPADSRKLLLSQTAQGGSDGLLWLSRRTSARFGYTLLAGAHRQSRKDLDGDGWTDIPGYTRFEARPRLFWNGRGGSSVLFTVGGTTERRTGGTLPRAVVPSGLPFAEGLNTRHVDGGAIAKVVLAPGTHIDVRASAMGSWQDHTFGTDVEHDRRTTAFGEASLSLARSRHSLVLGLAVQHDGLLTTPDVGFDYGSTVASLFGEDTYTPDERLSFAASARVDHQSGQGTFFSPRLSALEHLPGGWDVRASAEEGSHATTADPGDAAAEVGFAGLAPLGTLRSEQGRSGSLDVEGPLGPLRLNATLFDVRIDDPVLMSPAPGDPLRLSLANANGPLRSTGAELYAVYDREPFLVTGTWSWTDAREPSPDGGPRVDVPLTPKDAGGIDIAFEDDDPGESGFRTALEVFRTGAQRVEEDPYRTFTPPYTTVEVLVSQRIGRFTVFANGEDLTDVRQTRWDPLLRAVPGPGGTWTTDQWAPLEGRVVRLGVQASF